MGKTNEKYIATKKELEKLIFEDKMSFVAIGKKYNVSNTTIKNRCISLNIDLSKKNKSYKKIKKDNTPISDDDTEISINNVKSVESSKLSNDADSLYYESESEYYDVPPNTPFAKVTHYM
jgi:hypothetical protein